jgi:serine-type D-Ala-D-Ala carboxypeptidase/endopeptidase (penicillin-binding protein 4)
MPLIITAQESTIEKFLSDSAMVHASMSILVADAGTGRPVLEYKPDLSLTPASVLKLVSSASALELLGPDYKFRTVIGYRGSLNKHSGILKGDIIIKGGGDPALGSKYFPEHYKDFLDRWIKEIRKAGIKRVYGKVIADDSYYDFLPVPARWLWEDAGNYYGAGAFGLSVFDNTYEIHLKRSSGNSDLKISGIFPEECRYEFANWLVAAGTADEGYVFAAPYSTKGWLAGTVPADMDNFILKASIADPPLLLAKMTRGKLEAEGIPVSGDPTTVRLEQNPVREDEFIPVSEAFSPPLSDIIGVLNHESINFYAEHLLKELGKVFRNNGSTSAGIDVVYEFLAGTGIRTDGIFIEDGSGLSPMNAVTSSGLTKLLIYMKQKSRHFPEFYNSLPDAGKEGTMKNYFRDPLFIDNLKAKSGSMTRVRSYSGYFRTKSGKELIFCIIINNFSGPPQIINSGIEAIIKEIILNN